MRSVQIDNSIDAISLVKGLECAKCGDKDRKIQQLEHKIEIQNEKIKKMSEQNQQLTQELQGNNSFTGKKPLQDAKASFGSPNISGSGNSLTNPGLKPSNKILLNNFIRKVKVFVDNQEDQESDNVVKL